LRGKQLLEGGVTLSRVATQLVEAELTIELLLVVLFNVVVVVVV
jgi:hypothetical protein